jgi:hypothetical protein
VLDSTTVTEVFPLNFGPLGMLEPHPVIKPIAARSVRVIGRTGELEEKWCAEEVATGTGLPPDYKSLDGRSKTRLRCFSKFT